MARSDVAEVGLIGLLLLGFLLRVFELGASSLWLDEIHSYQRALGPSWEATRGMLVTAGHAPLYEAVFLHRWLKIGVDEFILRFPSSAFGVLNIAVTYVLGKSVFGAKVGLLSALVQSLSPLHIYYSQEARMYTLAGLLTTVSVYCFVNAYRNEATSDAWKYWAGYVLCGALGFYTHYLTALIPLVLSVFAILDRLVGSGKRKLQSVLLANGVMGLIFAPWLPTLRLQLQYPRLPWVPPFSLERIFNIVARFFLNKQALGQVYPVLVVSVAFTIGAGLFSVYLRLRSRTYSENQEECAIVTTCALGPVFLIGLVSAFKPIAVDRYFLIVIPSTCILLALGIVQLGRFRVALPLMIAVGVGMATSAYGVASTDWKEDWEGVASYVNRNSRNGDVIALIPGILRLPFDHYYEGPLKVYDIPGDVDESNNVKRNFDKLESFTRLWVVEAERFEASQEVEEYVSIEYGRDLLSCEEFGGFYGVDVCLYGSE